MSLKGPPWIDSSFLIGVDKITATTGHQTRELVDHLNLLFARLSRDQLAVPLASGSLVEGIGPRGDPYQGHA